jgi:vesicle-fusing ATPase
MQNIKWINKKDNIMRNEYIYVGYLDINKVKIRWITDDTVCVVSESTSYHEKTHKEIVEWTKKHKIGGLNNIIWEMYRHLVILRNPNTIDVLKKNGLKPSKGVILYGPPGTGKTKIARSLGELLGSRTEHIILVSATDLLSKWMGESEKNIAKLFEPAEKSYHVFGSRAPLYTIIIDEIDVIAQQRGTYHDTTGVRDGMVNQLLTKIDGLIEKDNIVIVGLTNREKLLDPALLREGRFDRMIYIGLPDKASRRTILELYIRPWIANVNTREVRTDLQRVLDDLANNTDGFSGADLQGFVAFSVKEYWSTILGISDTDKCHIPISFFANTQSFDHYKKIKS